MGKTGLPRKCIPLRIQPALLKRVDAEALANRVSRQQIIEGAINDRFSAISQEERDALIARRLNRVDTRLRVLEREVEIMAEMLGLFLRMWFAVHAELPEDQRDAALRKGQQRYEKFLTSLARRIGSGQSVLTDLPKELLVREGDF